MAEIPRSEIVCDGKCDRDFCLVLLILALDNDVILGDPLIFCLLLSFTTDQIIQINQ
jgi:hypothetical protein